MKWREWEYVAEPVDSNFDGLKVRIVQRMKRDFAPEDDRHVTTLREGQARELRDSLNGVLGE